jgi:hypothetical protein
MKKGGWKFVVLCDMEGGVPFFVLLNCTEGKVEHPLNVIPVCC